MIVHIVRHGCAGDKRHWHGPDHERPLDPAGKEQAEGLAELLVGTPLTAAVASPATRCQQTLEPLAARAGLLVATSMALAPGAGSSALALVVEPSSAGAVLCTHGEVMAPLLGEIRASGATLVADRQDDGWLLAKGTLWTMTVDGGRVVHLWHRAPAGVRPCHEHADSQGR